MPPSPVPGSTPQSNTTALRHSEVPLRMLELGLKWGIKRQFTVAVYFLRHMRWSSMQLLSLTQTRPVTLHGLLNHQAIPMTHKSTHLPDQIIGICLALVGLGFLVLLVALKHGRQLAGDLKVSVFIFGCGVALIWTGSNFLMSSPEEPKVARRNSLERILVRLRPGGELLAAIGCVLMLSRIIALLRGAAWPPEALLEGLLVGPVVVGLFTLKILMPGAFQTGLFPHPVVQNWSANIRHLLDILLRVGWLGYFAIPLALPDVGAHIPAPWRGIAQIVACSLIFILYASQLVVLRFGAIRRSE
jgi:hypothetical protein